MMLAKVFERPVPPDLEAALALVVRAIEANPAPLGTEVDAQNQLALCLGATATTVYREHRVNEASRIDFYCLVGQHRIGVEVKINKGQRSAMFRQLRRYADSGAFDGLIIASNRALQPPDFVGHVPVRLASLGRAWL
jgi:hypothetical protein